MTEDGSAKALNRLEGILVRPAVGIIVGVLIGSSLSPSFANAANAAFEIVGLTGHRAQVSVASQLKTAEAFPKSFQGFQDAGVIGTNCDVLTRGILKPGYIVRQWMLEVGDAPTTSVMGLFLDSHCAGSELMEFTLPAGAGTYTIPFAPGLALRARQGLYVGGEPGNDPAFSARSFVYGYTVPPADVPHNTTSKSP